MDLADLPDLGPEATHTYGGKAAGLARLIALGAAVPEGFAVPCGLLEPEAWPGSARDAFKARCAALLAAGQPIAVRSSARGEDGAEKSFAGLFETVLGVSDLPGAWEAARKCVLSGGSERVLAYAGREEPLPVGLVVQRQVPAVAAGVLFTADPAGADPGLVVEAVRGTGEALVGGRAAPARWRAYRAGTGAVEVQAVSPVPDEILSGCQVSELAIAAWDLAGRWGTELDLEWAIDSQGLVHWLQARPITARTPWVPPDIVRSVPDADDGPVTVWANFNVRETLPDPMPPLTWSIWSDSIMPALARDVLGMPAGSAAAAKAVPLDLVNGRVYFNMNAMLASPLMRGRQLQKMLAFIDSRAARTAALLFDSRVLRARRLPTTGIEFGLSLLRGSVGGVRRLLTILRPEQALRGLAASADATLAGPPVSALSDADLVDALGLIGAPSASDLRDGIALANVAFFLWYAADRLFSPWPEARRLLAAGVENNPTTSISVAIDDLADGAPPEFTADTLPGLAEFLLEFGHRAPREFDLLEPRWGDDPGAVLDLVRARLPGPAREHVRDRLAALRGARSREVSLALSGAPLWKRPLMRLLADAVPRFMPLREAPKHHAMRVFHRIRQAALEAGARLVARGVLDRPIDVFFLDRREVAGLLAAPEPIRDRVEARRKSFHSNKARKAPDFVRSDGVPVPEDEAEPGTDGLRGVGIGTGTGSGPVVILREPDPARFQDGSVLVVEFADPGWTPLFPRAAAIVMEVGGAMCHAAVVARELRIPAVFGVAGATRLLQDGDRVEVDGDGGIVMRLSAGQRP